MISPSRRHSLSVNIRLLRLVGLVLLVALVAACSRSERVAVRSVFPTPLIEPLPMRVGLYLGQDILSYQHQESLANSAEWTFELGAVQANLFHPLLEGMFQEVVLVTSPNNGAESGVQAVLEPRIEAFEFDIPSGHHNPFAEVWLEYSLHLYTADGAHFADWRVSGYGKSPATGSRPSGALEDATIRAMREAGANISLRFRSQPAVSDWLEGIRNANTTLGSVGGTR